VTLDSGRIGQHPRSLDRHHCLISTQNDGQAKDCMAAVLGRTLDQQESQAKAVHADGLTREEAIESLRELPQLWNDAEPSGRKLLAEALFERIDILGTRKVKLHPSASAKAQGWDRAWNGARLVVMVGARGVEPAIPTCRIVVPIWIADSLTRLL